MTKAISYKAQFFGISCALFLITQHAHAADVLYDQDFESPVGFVNEGGDFNKGRPVNALYGGQPPGFEFAQTYTVETVLLTGTIAYRNGYQDPSGIGGNYAIGMFSNREDDRLGLSFDLRGLRYLNLRADISGLSLEGDGFRNMPAPVFKFSLFDNPNGSVTIGQGSELDSVTVTGSTSAPNTLDWRAVLIGLDSSASTNGKVILQIDLLEGDYAVFDNLRIAASDKEGDVGRRYAP